MSQSENEWTYWTIGKYSRVLLKVIVIYFVIVFALLTLLRIDSAPTIGTSFANAAGGVYNSILFTYGLLRNSILHMMLFVFGVAVGFAFRQYKIARCVGYVTIVLYAFLGLVGLVSGYNSKPIEFEKVGAKEL